MPGLTWDNPNLGWGDHSYLLEPGDPGYTAPPTPTPANPTTTHTPRTMSNNAIPEAEKPVLALAEDCADGCAALEDSLPLKLIREADPRGTRSDDDRVLIQVVGVDTAWREYAKSGGDGEHLIKDPPSGAVLKVRILALNGSLEAPSGPEAQISVV